MNHRSVALLASAMLVGREGLSFVPVGVPTRSNTGGSISSSRKGPSIVDSSARLEWRSSVVTAEEEKQEDAPSVALEKEEKQAENAFSGMQIPNGLRETFHSNVDGIRKRFWIVDNSGSMVMHDGHKLMSAKRRQNKGQTIVDKDDEECTRWKEVQETVKCHAMLSAFLQAPTEFRFLNPPLQKRLPGGSVLLRGNNQKFRVGYSDGGRAVARDIQRAQSIMDRNQPSGMTAIPKAIAEVRNEIIQMLPQLKSDENDNNKVAIVIATDGCNYSIDNIGNKVGGIHNEEDYQQEMLEALQSLRGLPVHVVIRLCTDHEPIVDFYNGLDAHLEDINLDVLDDYHHEAQEVYTYNPWLNYAMVLHRMREMGQQNELFDLLDERPFTKHEIRDFCILLFGKQEAMATTTRTSSTPPAVLPDPEDDWIGFIMGVDRLQQQEHMQMNPIRHEHEPWINIKELASLE